MDSPVVSLVATHLLGSSGHILFWTLVWAAIVAVPGVLLGVLSFRSLSRRGAWDLEWRHGRWVRRSAALWMVLASLVGGAALGASHGVLKGVDSALHAERFRSDVLGPVGEQGALFLALLDLELQGFEPPARAAAIDAFVQGERLIDIAAFRERFDLAGPVAVEIVRRLEASFLGGSTLPESARGGLEWVLDSGVADVVHKVEGTLDGRGIERFLDSLEVLGGGPGVEYRALVEHIVDHAAIPLILEPLGGFVRSQQVILLALIVAALLFPPLLFWGIRWNEARGAEKPPPQPRT
jgi:hypothetical protein